MCRPNSGDCWLCARGTEEAGHQPGCAGVAWVALAMVCFWAGFVWAFS
jgi:hypothetical protein